MVCISSSSPTRFSGSSPSPRRRGRSGCGPAASSSCARSGGRTTSHPSCRGSRSAGWRGRRAAGSDRPGRRCCAARGRTGRGGRVRRSAWGRYPRGTVAEPARVCRLTEFARLVRRPGHGPAHGLQRLDLVRHAGRRRSGSGRVLSARWAELLGGGGGDARGEGVEAWSARHSGVSSNCFTKACRLRFRHPPRRLGPGSKAQAWKSAAAIASTGRALSRGLRGRRGNRRAHPPAPWPRSRGGDARVAVESKGRGVSCSRGDESPAGRAARRGTPGRLPQGPRRRPPGHPTPGRT